MNEQKPFKKLKTVKKALITAQKTDLIDEIVLFERVSAIIENRKYRAQAQANQEGILMFWEIGKHIGSVLLGGERAGYGKQIVVTLHNICKKIMVVALSIQM